MEWLNRHFKPNHYEAGMAKNEARPPALVWKGANYARVPEGRYQAVAVRHQGPEWIRPFARWSLLMEFQLLDDFNCWTIVRRRSARFTTSAMTEMHPRSGDAGNISKPGHLRMVNYRAKDRRCPRTFSWKSRCSLSR